MIFPSHHLLRDRQAIRKKKQKFNNDIAESVSLLIKKKKKNQIVLNQSLISEVILMLKI